MLAKSSKVVNYVLFYMSSIKYFSISSFFKKLLLLSKIQDGGNFGWRHRPPAAPQPKAYNRLFTKGKNLFKILWHNENPRGGGGSINPSPNLSHGGHVTLLVRPRVKRMFSNDKSKLRALCFKTHLCKLKVRTNTICPLNSKQTSKQVVQREVTRQVKCTQQLY